MALNSKKTIKNEQAPKPCVLNRKKTTIPKGVFETEAQKLNTQLVKMIVNG